MAGTTKQTQPDGARYSLDSHLTQAFAVFLRLQAEAWRIRRVDRFQPEDFHLAMRQITLQGRIPLSLFHYFQAENEDVLPRLAEIDPADGDVIVATLPAAQQAKHSLLHRFSVRDETGESLPLLTRSAGARVTAAHVLSSLIGAHPSALKLWSTWHSNERDETRHLIAFLTTLAFLNPHALAVRAQLWAREERLVFRPGAGLNETDRMRWVKHEGDRFVPGLGDLLVGRIQGSFLRGPYIPIPVEYRPGGLAHFPTVADLATHAIRDVLKVVVNRTSIWDLGSGGIVTRPREDLIHDKNELADQAHMVLEHGLLRLNDLLALQPDGAAASELVMHLDRWMAYVVKPIRLGEPFLIKLEELLPVSASEYGTREFRKAIGQTRLVFPLALKDAAAVHVEVEMGEPELRIGMRKLDMKRKRLSVRFGSTWHTVTVTRSRWWKVWSWRVNHFGELEALPALKVDDHATPDRLDRYFGHRDQPTEQVLTLYTSRAQGEAPDRDPGPTLLVVPIKLAHYVSVAYTGAALFALVAALFSTGSWIVAVHRLFEGKASDVWDIEAVITVNILGFTLSTLLIGLSHRRPVVHKKLVLLRYLVATTFVLFFVPPVLFGVIWVCDAM